MHPKNKTRYKSLDKVAADPRVIEVHSEESEGDGLWVSLAPGYNWEGCSSVHEYTAKDLIRAFASVEAGPCY